MFRRISWGVVGCVPGWSCFVGEKSEVDADDWFRSGVGVGRVDYLGSPDEARRVRAVRPLGYFEVAGKSTKVRNAVQGVDVDASFGNVWMRACSDEVDPEQHCSREVHVSTDVDLHPRRRSDLSADVTMRPPSCGDSSVHGPASRLCSTRTGPSQSCSDPDSRTSSRSPLRCGPVIPSASFARKHDPPLLSSPEDADSIIPYSALTAPPPISIDASSFSAVDSAYLEAAWNSAIPDDENTTQALL